MSDRKLCVVGHLRLPETYADRPFVVCDRTSIFGNPYRIGPDGNREQVISKFRRALDLGIELWARAILARLPDLRGKVLLCHCWPAACHCDVIAERVNALSEETP